MTDVRAVAERAAADGAEVVLATVDGAFLRGNVDRALDGGIAFVERRDGGRSERIIWYASIDSMTEFDREARDEPA